MARWGMSLTTGGTVGVLAGVAAFAANPQAPAVAFVAAGVAGTVAAFAPTWLQWRADRTAAIRTSPQSVALASMTPAEYAGSFTELLTAQRHVVAFVGRTEELAAMRRFAQDDTLLRLVVGPGGVGKTRFAIEAEGIIQSESWPTRWLGLSDLQNALTSLRGHHLGNVVLIIDYAEARSGLAELIRQACSSPEQGQVKLILLSRSAGDWWERLRACLLYTSRCV